MKTVEMPKMGDTMEEGKILRWLKQEGDQVKKGEPVAEIETDKVNIEIESFSSGVLRKILVPEGSSAPIGASIALVGSADEPLPESASASAAQAQAQKSQQNGGTQAPAKPAAPTAPAMPTTTAAPATERGRIFISPIARRLAEEHQLDYTKLQGTGPNGRIIKMDVEAVLATQKALPAEVEEVVPEAPAPVAAAVSAEEVVEVPLTSMRRTIARRLTQQMQAAPHIYVTSVIDTTNLAVMRKQINEFGAKSTPATKVSFNDLIVKASSIALKRIPEVNASFAEDRILLKKQVNIGIAVALDQGLIVPVLRNADQRTILDVARESQRLIGLARGGKLRPEDITGGTFSVSNLGMLDVDSFTAVINPPEAAILAVGAITPTPVVVDGEVVVRDRMKVTISADHRVLDGAVAARFLQEIKRLLEEPFGLLL